MILQILKKTSLITSKELIPYSMKQDNFELQNEVNFAYNFTMSITLDSKEVTSRPKYTSMLISIHTTH